MEDRGTKFRKFLETLPRMCSPTICGTLSQPTTRAERSRTEQFEWSLEQKAILSPANITMATCSDLAINDQDHSFLQQESDRFFSQKIIAPSPMTTPSTRNISRPGRPARYNAMMFDERDEFDEEDSDNDDDEEEDTSEKNDEHDSHSDDEDDDHITERYARNELVDIDIDEVESDEDDGSSHDEGESDEDDEVDNRRRYSDSHDDEMQDEADEEEDGEQDMDRLFLSPPMRSSQTQQRIDFSSPDKFEHVMEDDDTIQSTPKIYGSQNMRTRTRRGSEMSE